MSYRLGVIQKPFEVRCVGWEALGEGAAFGVAGKWGAGGVSGFGVWGLGFGVWGLGFGVWGLGCWVWWLWFEVWGLG
jgi:hypothetical protein